MTPYYDDYVVVGSSFIDSLPGLVIDCDKEQQQQQQHNNELSFSPPPPAPPDNALVKDWVDCICSCTPTEFRDTVKRSGGRFLYRGAEDNPNKYDDRQSTVTSQKIQQRLRSIKSSSRNNDSTQSQTQTEILSYVQNPEPDLLLPETYNNNPLALSYFQCLEQRLSQSSPPSSTSTSTSGNNINNNKDKNIDVARPSNGHIGTSDSKEAGRWGGDVVSIWPLGDTISYVWPQDRQTFCDVDLATTSTIISTKTRKEQLSPTTTVCQDDRLVINQRLVDALVLPREVLFTTTTGWRENTPAPFLAIPMEYDTILRNELNKVNYGLL